MAAVAAAACGGAHGGGDGAPARQLAIERELEGCRLQIAYSYRAQEGTFLVSRIDHPSLGLVSVTPALGAPPRVLPRHRDRSRGVGSRAPGDRAPEAEAIPVLRAIVPALPRSEQLGHVRAVGDDSARLRTPRVRDRSRAARARGDGAGAARPRDRGGAARGPAAAGARGRSAWRALRGSCAGSLAMGDLSIDRTFQGAPVELFVWDAGGARRTFGSPWAIRAASARAPARSARAGAGPRRAGRAVGAPGSVDLLARAGRTTASISAWRTASPARAPAAALGPASSAADASRASAKLVAALYAVRVALDQAAAQPPTKPSSAGAGRYGTGAGAASQGRRREQRASSASVARGRRPHERCRRRRRRRVASLHPAGVRHDRGARAAAVRSVDALPD